MKKYGRKIRKSYFPNLILKIDCKFSDPKLSNISSQINFCFHNTLFRKNFLLNLPKKKQNGKLLFLSRVEFLNLKPDRPPHGNKISLNYERRKHEFQNPTNWLTTPGLPSLSSISPELIAPEFIPPNCSFVNFIYPNLRFLKVKYSGNNIRAIIYKIRSLNQILWNKENLFLSENRLFFSDSKIQVIHQIISQKEGSAVDSLALSPILVLAASSLSRVILSRALRKIDELIFSSRDTTFGGNNQILSSITGVKGFGSSDGSLELIKGHSKFMHLKEKSWARKITVENSQIRRSSTLKRSKRITWRIQELIGWREKQNLVEREGTQSLDKRIEKQFLIEREEKQNLAGRREKHGLNESKEKQIIIKIKEKKDFRELIDSGLLDLVTRNRKQNDSSKNWAERAVTPVLDKITNSLAQPGSEVIQNTRILPLIQFRIKSFPKNNLLSYYECSFGSQRNEIFQNIVQVSYKDILKFPKNKSKQLLFVSDNFSTQNTTVRIKILRSLNKNLYFGQNESLKEDMYGFSDYFIRPIFELISATRSSLSKNNILSSEVTRNIFDIISRYHNNRTDLDSKWHGKKYMENNRSVKVFLEYFTSTFQQYPKTLAELRAEFFEKIFIFAIEKQTKGLHSILNIIKLNILHNLELKSSGYTTANRFSWFENLTKNTFSSQLYPQASHTLISTTFSQPKYQGINELKSAFFSSSFHARVEPASKVIIPMLTNQRNLLAGNKLVHAVGTYRNDSSENIIQEEEYYPMNALVQKMFKLTDNLMSSSKLTIGDKNPANLQKTSLIQEYNNAVTCMNNPLTFTYNAATYKHNPLTSIPDKLAVKVHNFTTSRIFKFITILKSTFKEEYVFNHIAVYATGIKKTFSHSQQVLRIFNYRGINTFSDTPAYSTGREYINRFYRTTYHQIVSSHFSNFHIANLNTVNVDTANFDTVNFDTVNVGTANVGTANVTKFESKNRVKREKQHFDLISKLKSTLNQHIFSRPLDMIIYKLKMPEFLLYIGKQSFISNKIATSIPGVQETNVFSSQENLPLYTSSVYTSAHSARMEFNYQEIHMQSYPAVPEFYIKKTSLLDSFTNRLLKLKKDIINYLAINSHTQGKAKKSFLFLVENIQEKINHLYRMVNLKLFSLSFLFPGTDSSRLLPTKEILKHFEALFLLSREDLHTATESVLTLSKVLNPILEDKLLSKGLISGRPLDASVTQFSGTAGISSSQKAISEYGRSRYHAPGISQKPALAGKTLAQSSVETGGLQARNQERQKTSISHFNTKQKQSGQKVPYWKTARMNLSLVGGEIENANKVIFLKKNSVKILKRENGGLQINENIDISAEPYLAQRAFSNFIMSSIPDLTPGKKWKKVFSAITRPVRAGEKRGISAYGSSEKGRSELKHSEAANYKVQREELVHGAPQVMLEDIKKIEKIVFEMKEAVTDNLGSHLRQAGEASKDIDIEQMSDKIMQMINYKLEIEAERRGIF